MRKPTAQPPILTVRIQFQPPSPSPTSTEPDTQLPTVDHGQVRSQMTDAEIIRSLKAVRHSCEHERLAKRSQSMKGLAASVGFSREYLYQVLRGERELTFNLRAKLSEFLSCEQIDGETNVIRRPR